MTALRSDGPLRFLVGLLLVLLAWILRPVLVAIVIGSFAALVGHGPYERLVVALRGRRGWRRASRRPPSA